MTGFLLINTGSPRSASVGDVREYLTDFLTDPRVMNLPFFLRQLLVRGIIVPFRAPKSALKYRSLFSSDGEALLVKETKALASRMAELSGGRPVYTAMRYGRETVQDALKKAARDGVTGLRVIPMFPHYAMSSFETAMEHVRSEQSRLSLPVQLTFPHPYFSHPLLIEAFAEKIAAAVRPHDRVLCSYHGVPLSQLRAYAGDSRRDYVLQTEETTRLLSKHPLLETLGLTFETVYQSRFGKGKWTEPNAQERLSELRDQGLKRVTVVCPGFLCDNLETVFEIGVEAKESFEKSGGNLIFIPCPNHSDTLARALLSLSEGSDFQESL